MRIKSGEGNAAYDAFFAGDAWKLVKPDVWIDTNWADRNKDGVDDYPDSCLDFGAVCANGTDIETSCRVIERAGDFPDTKASSDHRPVLVRADWQSLLEGAAR